MQVAAVVQYFCHRWRCHSITQHHVKLHCLNPKDVAYNCIEGYIFKGNTSSNVFRHLFCNS